MKLSEDNKEAVKSSIMVGVTHATSMGGIMLFAGSENWYYGVLGGFFIGLFLGLITTCYLEDE